MVDSFQKLKNALYKIVFPVSSREDDSGSKYFTRIVFEGFGQGFAGFVLYNFPALLRGQTPPPAYVPVPSLLPIHSPYAFSTYLGKTFPQIAPAIEPATKIIGPIMMGLGLLAIASSVYGRSKEIYTTHSTWIKNKLPKKK